MDCGEETVKTHLKRGRATLSMRLQEQGLQPFGAIASATTNGEEK
jgi:hypothetical protein